MLKQLALLAQNKIALAAIGTVLVAGAGAAVAVANNRTGQSPAAAHSNASANGSDHAHTISVEGTLKAYDASGKTITVQPKGDGAKAMTITVNSQTEVNGAHANTLADLTHHVGDDVQVQATKQSNGSLLAWKITVQGSSQGTGDDGSSDGQNANQIHGTVASVNVGASSFMVKLEDGSTVTVTVSSATAFDGRAHKLADLVKGTSVLVHGTKQSNGSILADRVAAPDDGGDGHP
jgi:hypothetical protein